MRIDPVHYMQWAKSHSQAKISLSRSGLADCSLGKLEIDPSCLEIRGEHPYGYPPLIEAIAARYRVGEGTVVPVNGASQGIFFAAAALLEPGDDVLVEGPAYEPLIAVPHFFGAGVRRFSRRFENAYAVNLDEIRASLTERTKLIILTNLHNPSGALLDDRSIGEVATVAAEKGAFVFVDEIYLEFLEGKAGATSFHLAENIVVTSSLTKAFGLGGLRCGWLFAPEKLAVRMRRLVDLLSVEGVFIGEQISAKAFSRLDSLRERNRPLVGRNFALVRDFIAAEEKLEWVEPAAGIIAFPRIRTGPDGTELARFLKASYDTAVVPGHFFEEPRHFRLGFGVATEELSEGLARIHKALESW